MNFKETELIYDHRPSTPFRLPELVSFPVRLRIDAILENTYDGPLTVAGGTIKYVVVEAVYKRPKHLQPEIYVSGHWRFAE